MELMLDTMLSRSKTKQKKKTESKIALLSGLPQNKIPTTFRCEPTQNQLDLSKGSRTTLFPLGGPKIRDELESVLGNLPLLIRHSCNIIFASNCKITVSIFHQHSKAQRATKIRLTNTARGPKLEKTEPNKLCCCHAGQNMIAVTAVKPDLGSQQILSILA